MAVLTVGPLIYLRVAAWQYFSGAFAMNLSYTISGIAFLLPIVLILRKYQYKKALNIIIAVACFGLAIYFRKAVHEYTHVFSFGTHFLWHIFTGIGAYLLADYLYFMRTKELASLQTSTQ